MKKICIICSLFGIALCAFAAAGDWIIHPHATDNTSGCIVVKNNGLDYTIQAVPNAGYSFYSWSDGNSSDTRTFTATETEGFHVDYRAIFTRDADINIDGGSVAVTTSDYQSYTLTLTEVGDLDHGCGVDADFICWNDGKTGDTYTYTEGMGSIYPVIRRGDNRLKGELTPATGGTIQVKPLSCGFTLTAVPSPGYEFANWTDDNSTNPVRDVDYLVHSYTANFLPGIILNDNVDNSTKLAAADGTSPSNIYTNRSLVSSDYNTICLPFALSAPDITTAFGAGCEVYAFTSASSTEGVMTLNFLPVTEMAAGVPYLIKPAADVASLTFSQHEIVNEAQTITQDGVNFMGVFSPTELQADAQTFFLGANSLLYRPVTTGYMNGLRAYFRISSPAPVACRVAVGRNIATDAPAMPAIEKENRVSKMLINGRLVICRDNNYYAVDGRKINGK